MLARLVVAPLLLLAALPARAAELGRGPVFSVIELTFRGPRLGPKDAPVRDVNLTATFRPEAGGAPITVHGFWDGNGRGGATGDVFRVRFCPTGAGRWDLVAVRSGAPELDRQHEGDHVVATTSEHPGFWVVDDASPGRRWYRRSDGSHPYVVGKTHYSFLSGRRDGGRPTGSTIARDVARNAEVFRKLRFSLMADRYPDPDLKPFLDDDGRPTDDGDFAFRPNPRWFRERADAAVAAAFAHDLVADLILCGPDTEDARATLRCAGNGGDPTPWLRYVAARYGSYPNVWICLANEFDIKEPRYTARQIAGFGRTIRGFLPGPTPLSVHAAPDTWPAAFDALPTWHDHLIIQHKLRAIGPAADTIARAWAGPDRDHPRNRPVLDDELSYQGAGDRHSETDTIAAHVGALLGGGYGTTGFKPGNKLGHYFWGAFDPVEHTAAPSLRWLREELDSSIGFWRMAPDRSIFEGLDPGARALGRDGHEYLLGTDRARRGLIARLPEGRWAVRRLDVIARRAATLSESASGAFRFDAPDSRAVLFHFRRIDGE